MKDLNPRAVACSRSGTYDAEIIVCDVHWVVGTGYTTHKQAVKAATPHVTALRRRLTEVAGDFVESRKWKRAMS